MTGSAKILHDLAGNRLRQAIGSATFGVFRNGVKYSLKTVNKKGYAVNPTTYRQLRDATE